MSEAHHHPPLGQTLRTVGVRILRLADEAAGGADPITSHGATLVVQRLLEPLAVPHLATHRPHQSPCSQPISLTQVVSDAFQRS